MGTSSQDTKTLKSGWRDATPEEMRALEQQGLIRKEEAVGGGKKLAEAVKTGAAVPRFFGRIGENIIEPARRLGGIAVGVEEPQTTTGKVLRRLPGIGAPAAATGELAEGLLRAQGRQFQRAFSLEDVPTSERAGRVVAGMLPVFGPAAAEIGQELGEGNVPEALADITVLSASLSAPKVSRGIKAKRLGRAEHKLPEKVFQAVKPKAQQREAVRTAIPKVLQDEVIPRLSPQRKVTSLEDLRTIVNEARTVVGKDIESAIAAGPKGLSISGVKLAQAIDDSIRDISKLLDPNAVKQVKSVASRFRKRSFTFQQAEELHRQLNDRLAFFFRKNKVSQREAARAPEIAHELALRNALEQEIERVLSQGGDTLKPLRQRYSRLRAVQDSLHERIISEMVKENPSLLNFDSLDTLAAGSAVVAGLSGRLDIALVGAGTVLSRRVLTLINRIKARPDVKIKAAFDAIGKEPTAGNISKGVALLVPAIMAQEENPRRLGQ